MSRLSLVFLIACGSDVSIKQSSVCDGVQQPEEEWVDAPFDFDMDGFVDGNNPDCAEAYAATALDCNDDDPAISPGVLEITCNGVDDDCSPDTIDALDEDVDGWTSCDDCNDRDSSINPGAAEVVCNGKDDDCEPSTVDMDDLDADGYLNCEDCNDLDASTHPGQSEVPCNDRDDDCSEATPDSADVDLDGYSTCDDDCLDTNEAVNPGHDEACDDGLDNDCDGATDEDCFEDYTGPWDIDSAVVYTCAFGLVSINFSEIFVLDSNPSISVTSTGSGFQPGTTSGSFTSSTTFSTTNTLVGSCNETYSFSGTFHDANTATIDFTAAFSGACFDCSSRSWSGLTATRIGS